MTIHSDDTRSSSPSSPPEDDDRSDSPYVQARDPHRYRILGEHGRGGIGRVSRAYDRDLDRDVAIKELIARDHIGEARFLREAMITAKLEHPGIVPVHEAGRWRDGTPFYAMKLVAGRPLRDLIAERRTIDERIALLHHVIAIADAMAYAHRRHIIHRDLKPGNVIVGEFGETVVIDWGLAKDLSATAQPDDRHGAPSPSPDLDDLTRTGSVLGTPAYMAPEQARGEAVDQRVDVFAIGAMLWELCSLQKVPPTQPRQRHAMLRRAGIDRDLTTILDKALAPSAADRYHDAGELAADLKAFKAGARISARSYSLVATLGHWTRRHRALAVSFATVLVLALVGGTLYVRNITTERDRADLAQHRATDTLDALTLRHAQQLLATDPAAALDVLATYRGTDTSHARQITAEAFGRGAPVLRAIPQRGNILWIKLVPDAAGKSFAGVLSGSDDHTIVFTARDGHTRVLAHDVRSDGYSLLPPNAFTPVRQVLAYACEPDDVCMLDVARLTMLPRVPVLHGLDAWLVGFSPSGNILAVITRTGELTIFDVHDLAKPVKQMSRQLAPYDDIQFVDETTIASVGNDQVTIVPLASGSSTNDIVRIPLPEAGYRSEDPETHRIVVASAIGKANLIEGPPWHVAARTTLCQRWVSGIQWIPHSHEIAYTCEDGLVGVWNPDTGTVTSRAHLDGHANFLTVSPHGDYLLITGGLSQLYVLDLITGLLSNYKGFDIRPTAIGAPTTEMPFVTVGNARGEIRVWPLPPRIAKTVLTERAALISAAFSPVSPMIIVNVSRDDESIAFSPTMGTRTLTPHNHLDGNPVFSPDGKLLAQFAAYDEVELWSIDTLTRTQVFSSGHGALSRVRFLPDSTGVVTSGNDGRLIRWRFAGEARPVPSLLASIDQPIEVFALAATTRAVVFEGRDGSLWQTSLTPTGSPATRLPYRGARSDRRYHRMLTLPDDSTVYNGLDNGDVIAIDTRSHRVLPVIHTNGMVNEIAISPSSTTIAISTVNSSIYIGTRPTPDAVWAWRTLELRTIHHALTPDGILVALGTDGAIWLYSVVQDHWLCLPIGTMGVLRVLIDSTGDNAAVLTLEGVLIWLDLTAARKLLAAPPPPL